MNISEEIRQIYNEFGIDIHSVPPNLQTQVNRLAHEIVHLRNNFEKANESLRLNIKLLEKITKK
jgi:hypothetical protein